MHTPQQVTPELGDYTGKGSTRLQQIGNTGLYWVTRSTEKEPTQYTHPTTGNTWTGRLDSEGLYTPTPGNTWTGRLDREGVYTPQQVTPGLGD